MSNHGTISRDLAGGFQIGEVGVPTRYFKEASSVNFRNSVIYGLSTLWVMAVYLLNRLEMIHSARFHKRLRDVLSPYHQPSILNRPEDGGIAGEAGQR